MEPYCMEGCRGLPASPAGLHASRSPPTVTISRPMNSKLDRMHHHREMREVMSRKEKIRMSPWKINLLTRQVIHVCPVNPRLMNRVTNGLGVRQLGADSPWCPLSCYQIRGLPVVEALMQLKFSRKQKGPPIVAQTIKVRHVRPCAYIYGMPLCRFTHPTHKTERGEPGEHPVQPEPGGLGGGRGLRQPRPNPEGPHDPRPGCVACLLA